MKILYIEDNEQMALVVSSILRTRGYEVEHFYLGKPGLERFYNAFQTWDAVIVDLDLPDISGKSLIPEMSAQRPGLPIIVYSGANGLDQRFELYGAGASALLSKPCGAEELLDVLKGLIDIPPEVIK